MANRCCLPASQTAVLSEHGNGVGRVRRSRHPALLFSGTPFIHPPDPRADQHQRNRVFNLKDVFAKENSGQYRPGDGITKLNGAIILTRFTFSSALHRAKATDESNVRYPNTATAVRLCTASVPPVAYPLPPAQDHQCPAASRSSPWDQPSGKSVCRKAWRREDERRQHHKPVTIPDKAEITNTTVEIHQHPLQTPEYSPAFCYS